MMLVPKPIHSRKMALIMALGFDPHQALEDGFDDDGFELLGDWSHHARSSVMPLRQGELIRTKIAWPDERWSQRAHEARVADYAETMGLSVGLVESMAQSNVPIRRDE